MDLQETGKAICYLRKQAGMTQSQLADYLKVSDKAVSKWERGLSCPDVSLLPKISILLDTDIESLLYGHHFQFKTHWCGILLLEGSRIDPTVTVYDKPLVYYSLSYFLLLGIREILINGMYCSKIRALLGDGSKFGVSIHYDQGVDCFAREKNVALLDGYTIYYGLDLTRSCQRAMAFDAGSVALAIHGRKQETKEVYTDSNRKIIKEKARNTLQEHYYMAPFLFCKAKDWKQVKTCGTIEEMTDTLLISGQLYAETIGRGMLRFDLTDEDSLLELANFVKLTQRQQGEQIACLPEIAWRRGLITKEMMYLAADRSNEAYIYSL